MGVIPESGDVIAETGNVPAQPGNESVEAQTPEQDLLMRLIELLARQRKQEQGEEKLRIEKR